MENAQLLAEFTDTMAKFTSYLSKHLPDDVLQKLKELRAEQNTELAKVVYDTMFRDLDLAEEKDVPICQDTGVIQYFVELGANFPIRSGLEECLREATIRATKEAPLRHNAVQIFSERNSGNNTGRRIPWIEVEIVPDSDECLIYGYMAGGGCSLPGTAKVFMPGEGYEAVVQYVFDTMCERGINACPPLLVGVGIAGSVEVAAMLSKKALMRPIGSHHPTARGTEFETMLEDGLNRLNIGPQGLTGVKTVFGVNVEDAARHPSCIAAGVSVGCWAHRRAAIRFKPDLSYELPTHKGQTL
jgi:L(+)-tartrate dehydratase alpha subunit